MRQQCCRELLPLFEKYHPAFKGQRQVGFCINNIKIVYEQF